MKNKLVLENGKVFEGLNFGANENKIGELCFITSMVGYQDVLSDPSYYNKIVCMTYPLIGNYGLTDDDYDFKNIFVNGYVVKENNDLPSNFRSTRTLSEAMEENHVVGISDVDTREIVKILRDEGLMKAVIANEQTSVEECLQMLKDFKENEVPSDVVSCKKIWYSRTANPSHSVVVIDLGVKTTLVKKLNEYGLNAIVVPYNTPFEQIKKLRPNGIVISNGPGNPNKFEETLKLLSDLKGRYPLLGLGLGAQLIALLYGGKVTKMKHGHQGANLPVKNLLTGKIEITSQNHFYAIDLQDTDLKVTHKGVLDGDIEGFVDEKAKIIGSQLLVVDTLSEEENIINRFIKIMKK
jgi:carbamoyl-phosphate synthase small subunit